MVLEIDHLLKLFFFQMVYFQVGQGERELKSIWCRVGFDEAISKKHVVLESTSPWRISIFVQRMGWYTPKWSNKIQHGNFTLWLFNIAMENGSFIDGLPGFTY